MEFKNMTKMDALKTLNSELEKLKKTSTSDEEKKSFDKNFDGFQNLFRKYLEADVSAPISWEKIEKLPAGSVSLPQKLSEVHGVEISGLFFVTQILREINFRESM